MFQYKSELLARCQAVPSACPITPQRLTSNLCIPQESIRSSRLPITCLFPSVGPTIIHCSSNPQRPSPSWTRLLHHRHRSSMKRGHGPHAAYRARRLLILSSTAFRNWSLLHIRWSLILPAILQDPFLRGPRGCGQPIILAATRWLKNWSRRLNALRLWTMA